MSRITYINASHSKTNEVDLISSYFTVEREFWKKDWKTKRRMRQTYETSLAKDGMFLAGWNNRVAKFLREEGKSVRWRGEDRKAPAENDITLDGITLKPFQREFVTECIEAGRGVILSPTGSGKTVMAGAVLSAYPNDKRLVLCHSKDLLHQTARKLKKYGLKVSKVGDGNKDTKGDVIVAIVNSWTTLPKRIQLKIKVVIVDECHHVNSEGSLYYKTLLKLENAWNRFGFTATLPSSKEGKLICEGCLGPVIRSLSIRKGRRIGIVSNVKVELLDAPYLKTESTTYKDLYKERIINNTGRNAKIADKVMSLSDEGNTCLIYVKEIEHGKILKKLIPKSIFVEGAVAGWKREKIRRMLDSKEIMSVVTTTAWKEGVDIPSLNAVMNAAGGMSEIGVLQNAGRGMRVTEEKDKVLIIDFIDHGKYLAEHACNRIAIYAKNKWL